MSEEQHKYPRFWNHRDGLWFQIAEGESVLFVWLRHGAAVRTSTFTPDQLSSQPVEVEEATAALAAKESK